MDYSDVISKGFRGLKSGALWGFLISTIAAELGIGFVVGVIGALASGVSAIGLARRTLATPGAAFVGPFLVFIGFVLLGIVLVIPITLIQRAGLVRLTDLLTAGEPATVGEGWSFGARRIGRIFSIDIVIGIIGTAIVIVGLVPLILGIVGAGRGNTGGAVAVGLCGGFLFTLLAIVVLIVLNIVEEISIRYGLIGNRTAGDALSSGWQAFRARLGSGLLVWLIVFALSVAAGIIQEIVNVIGQFLAFGTAGLSGAVSRAQASPGTAIGAFMTWYSISLIIAIFLGMIVRIIGTGAWTAFFRQMTGLDTVGPSAPQYAYPMYPPQGPAPYGAPMPPSYPPAAPQPPVAPEPPEPPMAPQPPVAPEPPAAAEPPEGPPPQ